MNIISEIKECIEKQIDAGIKKFIIYPYGDIGIQAKQVLLECYGIEAEYILDNHLCKYNSEIKNLSFLSELNCNEYAIVLATLNKEIYTDMKKDVEEYFHAERIAELRSMIENEMQTTLVETVATTSPELRTKVGKYSYGPLCTDAFVESVGAFCSFGYGTEAVENHELNYITTHPFLYAGTEGDLRSNYESCRDRQWFFEGVHPKGRHDIKRIHIGNDVWLGRNVLITNYSSIGNGVIAGSGAVITKDVPDYAVVAGVPARIIRYRYTPDQIKALNEIKWWDWSDEVIRERYDDFYLPIEEFINKYRIK